MAILDLINSGLDVVPKVIITIRDVIEKGLSLVNLTGMSFIVFWIISLFLAYIWVKQFVVSGFLKAQVLLNLILLALLIYVSLVYIK